MKPQLLKKTSECSTKLPDVADTVGSSIQKLVHPTHIAKNHSSSSIIRDVHSGIIRRKKERRDYNNMVANVCYISTVEPTTVATAVTG